MRHMNEHVLEIWPSVDGKRMLGVVSKLGRSRAEKINKKGMDLQDTTRWKRKLFFLDDVIEGLESIGYDLRCNDGG